MTEFDDNFGHPFLLSVLIIEGLVGWAVGWGGVGQGGVGWEVAKTTPWDTP